MMFKEYFYIFVLAFYHFIIKCCSLIKIIITVILWVTSTIESASICISQVSSINVVHTLHSNCLHYSSMPLVRNWWLVFCIFSQFPPLPAEGAPSSIQDAYQGSPYSTSAFSAHTANLHINVNEKSDISSPVQILQIKYFSNKSKSCSDTGNVLGICCKNVLGICCKKYLCNTQQRQTLRSTHTDALTCSKRTASITS